MGNASSYRDAVLLAANLGEDADTTAAIAGQLAGALWGASGIPGEWMAKLAWKERIMDVADHLHDPVRYGLRIDHPRTPTRTRANRPGAAECPV